eukprot:CAMPEP_0197480864 /NCGR_PEP_ID=MMETSP1309-20131121/43748_1 /TAXON_ID=464262 /ORGANISM="Genus nov. species nov., Strain RCC998" /LENGTH=42 /DNA_ID= /DNA_START= /DNA_END= /DNA_ORIENTATION=
MKPSSSSRFGVVGVRASSSPAAASSKDSKANKLWGGRFTGET